MSDKAIRGVPRDPKLDEEQSTKFEHGSQLSREQLMNCIKSLDQASRFSQCELDRDHVCNEKGCTGGNGRGEECIEEGLLTPNNMIVFLNCVFNDWNSAMIDDPHLETKLSDCVRHMQRDTYSYIFQVGESPYLTGEKSAQSRPYLFKLGH